MRSMYLTLLCLGSAIAAQASYVDWIAPGAPVEPSAMSVVLTPGDPLTVQICVTVPETEVVDLDVFLLEDLSGSFGDDLANLSALFGGLYTGLNGTYNSAEFGFGSFVDKPINPFGDFSSGDYVYDTHQAITGSQAAVQGAIDAATLRYGGDYEESQIEALMQAALRTGDVSWRSGSRRVVVLFSDAMYHEAGDFPSAPANNGDSILDGSPAGTGEDYPSASQVRDALVAANIVPIFAVTSDVVSYYQSLIDGWGIGGAVTTITNDSSNLVAAITSALEDVSTQVSLLVSSDPNNFVQLIDPTQFDDVLPGETVCFDVTLETFENCLEGDIVLNSPGFGSCIIHVTYDPALCTVAAHDQPGAFAMGQNYPNPFNPVTTIDFSIAETELVSLVVFDMQGREVVRLVDGMVGPGAHQVQFDAAGLPSGVYYYSLKAGSQEMTKKMVLLK